MLLLNRITSTFDAGKSALLQRLLQHQLGEAGTVNTLTLDTNIRTLAFILSLKGEAELLAVEIAYAVEHDKGGTWLIIREVKTSKAWASLLAKRHLPKRPRVPDALRFVL